MSEVVINKLLRLCGKDIDTWEGDWEGLCYLAVDEIEYLREQRTRVQARLCNLRDAAYAGNQRVNASHIQEIINLTLDGDERDEDECAQ